MELTAHILPDAWQIGSAARPPAHRTRLSCHRFRANEARLQLSVLAYNQGTSGADWFLSPQIKRYRSRVSGNGW